MTLDELIRKLVEAKEHGIDGRSTPTIYSGTTDIEEYSYGTLTDVIYDSNNVFIKYE